MTGIPLGREAVRRWYDAAIKAVEPRRAVVGALSTDGDELRVDGALIPLASSRVVVLAIGKAAAGMAQGAVDILGSRIDLGIILTKYGHVPEPVRGFDIFEAGHPVPDEQGLVATCAILESVGGLAKRDLVLALISGGGSALLEFPVQGVSLDDMRTTTRLLMHAGAGIHDLNAVRAALSRVKGGGLRRAIGQAQCVSVLLSDVLGSDPSVIASGPTVIVPRNGPAPMEVIARFGIQNGLPGAVTDSLSRNRAPSADPDTRGDVITIAADNTMFVAAVARAAEIDGLRVHLDPEPWDGDASDLGRALVRAAGEAPQETDVIVRGGEATVEVRGNGIGGRNTEMALAAALAMAGDDEWIIASLASDGDDGISGAAGAIADGMTLARAIESGVDPVAALVRNDSATVFRAVGGLVETGPTGTNVNDVYVAVRRRAIGETRNRR